MQNQLRYVQIYVAIISLLALAGLIYWGSQFQPSGDLIHWLLVITFFLLTALANRFFIQLSHNLLLQLDTIPIFASILLFQPLEAALLTSLSVLLITQPRKMPWTERIFNSAQVALYTGLTATVLAALTPTPWQPRDVNSWIGLFLAIVVQFTGNLLLVSGVISIQNHIRLTEVIRTIAGAHRAEHLVMVSLGWLTALVTFHYPWAIPLMAGPVVILYFSTKRTFRTEADLRSRQAELELIVSVSEALRSSTSKNEIITSFIKKTLELSSAQGGILALINPDTGNLEISQAVGVWQSLTGRTLRLTMEPVRSELKTNQLYTGPVEVAIQDPTMLKTTHPGSSILLVPLRVKENEIGILGITRESTFQDEDNRLLRAAADIAANAIHRTTLAERNQLHLDQLNRVSRLGETLFEVLSESQITSRLIMSLEALFEHVEACLVFLVDSEGSRLVCSAANSAGRTISPGQVLPIYQKVETAQIFDLLQTRRALHLTAPSEIAAFWNRVLPTHPPHIPFQTALLAPLIAHEKVIGVIWLSSLRQNAFQQSDEELVTLSGSIAAVTLQNARLFDDLHSKNIELTLAYDATLAGLANALELRDSETRGHSERVAALTLQLAERMKIPAEQLPHIRRGALLHDIGKIGVPDAILLKPGPLTPEEWQRMVRHPEYAYHLIREIPYLTPAMDIPYGHHEKWDGTGYPLGLKGDDIPQAARIFAIIDVWDALTSDRPYRAAWPWDKTLAYVQEQRGHHFDPRVVDAFLTLIEAKSAESLLFGHRG